MIDEILTKYPQEENFLIEILLEYQKQKESKFLTEKEVKRIAEYLSLTESKVCSVVSFYTLLSTDYRGKNVIQVCRDVPCHLTDDTNILQTLKDELGIEVYETTKDKQFTLEFTSCLGCCNESPVMRINETVYTNLDSTMIKEIINKHREVKK